MPILPDPNLNHLLPTLTCTPCRKVGQTCTFNRRVTGTGNHPARHEPVENPLPPKPKPAPGPVVTPTPVRPIAPAHPHTANLLLQPAGPPAPTETSLHRKRTRPVSPPQSKSKSDPIVSPSSPRDTKRGTSSDAPATRTTNGEPPLSPNRSGSTPSSASAAVPADPSTHSTSTSTHSVTLVNASPAPPPAPPVDTFLDHVVPLLPCPSLFHPTRLRTAWTAATLPAHLRHAIQALAAGYSSSRRAVDEPPHPAADATDVRRCWAAGDAFFALAREAVPAAPAPTPRARTHIAATLFLLFSFALARGWAATARAYAADAATHTASLLADLSDTDATDPIDAEETRRTILAIRLAACVAATLPPPSAATTPAPRASPQPPPIREPTPAESSPSRRPDSHGTYVFGEDVPPPPASTLAVPPASSRGASPASSDAPASLPPPAALDAALPMWCDAAYRAAPMDDSTRAVCTAAPGLWRDVSDAVAAMTLPAGAVAPQPPAPPGNPFAAVLGTLAPASCACGAAGGDAWAARARFLRRCRGVAEAVGGLLECRVGVPARAGDTGDVAMPDEGAVGKFRERVEAVQAAVERAWAARPKGAGFVGNVVEGVGLGVVGRAAGVLAKVVRAVGGEVGEGWKWVTVEEAVAGAVGEDGHGGSATWAEEVEAEARGWVEAEPVGPERSSKDSSAAAEPVGIVVLPRMGSPAEN
ncbi:hypothetical protein HDU96_009210 [Phlyctochytrium bullatum]|nr:hypothetical protein HDU96_009210 [Phlyctochytrium bullatum]